jgi:hypothetical protein
MLRIYEQPQREMPRRDARCRLEHCTVINPSVVFAPSAPFPRPSPPTCIITATKCAKYEPERLDYVQASIICLGLSNP